MENYQILGYAHRTGTSMVVVSKSVVRLILIFFSMYDVDRQGHVKNAVPTLVPSHSLYLHVSNICTSN